MRWAVPLQAAGSRWRYKSALSPPLKHAAPPVSPSPPSAGTCHSHHALHCPAVAEGQPGLKGAAESITEKNGEKEEGWNSEE